MNELTAFVNSVANLKGLHLPPYDGIFVYARLLRVLWIYVRLVSASTLEMKMIVLKVSFLAEVVPFLHKTSPGFAFVHRR